MLTKTQNYPSVKRIASFFRLELDKAKLVRQVMDGSVDPLDQPDLFPKTNKWVNSCYNMPRRNEIKMAALDELIGGFGVEAIGNFSDYPPRVLCDYINTGDTYSPTIILRNGRFSLGCWGDLAERCTWLQ